MFAHIAGCVGYMFGKPAVRRPNRVVAGPALLEKELAVARLSWRKVTPGVSR
jgi:hypothetical protein